MINMHERKSLTDRQKLQSDPISFYIWHIISEQLQIFVSYIFRAAKLIQISKEHNTLLNKLPIQLKKMINWEDDSKEDIQEKIYIKIEELLQIERSQFSNKIEGIREIVQKEYEKYKMINNSNQESLQAQNISRFSAFSKGKKEDRSNQIINISENTFLQDISYIQNQERKLKFKEQIVNPTKTYYKQLSRVQTNILNKINKIASFQDVRFQKLEKIRQIESTIEEKLESVYSKLLESSQKLLQLDQTQSQRHIQIRKCIRPTQINNTNTQRLNLQQLIQTKIFGNSSQLKQNRLQISQNPIQLKSQIHLKLEQQIKSNQLCQEKVEKAKIIQNYFRKYLQNKQKIKVIDKKQPPKTIIHHFKLDINRIGSQSNHTSNSTQRQKKGVVMITQQNIISFLQRQKSLSKKGYQEKLQHAKQKKIQQAIEQNDINIIINSGFNFGQEDYNSKDELQNTPLFYCAKKNLYEFCRFLLQNGANPNIKCSQGQTATHQACQHKNSVLLNLFTEYGADFNMPDNKGVIAQALLEKEQSPILQNQKNLQLNIKNVTSPQFDEFLVM